MSEPGWIRDPSNPGFERFHDGSQWTDRTRVAQARPSSYGSTRSLPTSGDGNGARVVMLALGFVVIVVVGCLAWFAVSGATDLSKQASGLATKAPAAANGAALESDVRSLTNAVQSSIVTSGGALPNVTLEGTGYSVMGPDGTAQQVPSSPGVARAGITGTSSQDYCVWVASVDGAAVHATATSGPSVGGC